MKNYAIKQFVQKARWLLTLSLLLTFGMGQMWAAQTYYYSGKGAGSSDWAKTAMTVSTDGFYEYIQITRNTSDNQFKIGTSSNQWAYNYTYVTSGYHCTNVSNVGDYGKDNCYSWHGSNHYILVYYPSTAVNSTANPIICASTTLPRDYAITVATASSAQGTVSPTSGYATSSSSCGLSITASPKTNYAFVNWTVTSGTASFVSATSASTTVSASAASTVTANFAPQWTLKGGDSDDTDPSDAMGNWETYNNFALVSGTTMRCTLNLAAKTTYSFKVYDRRNDTWYGNTSSFVGQTGSLTMATGQGDCHITTAKAGDYIFTFDNSAKTLTVTYPTETHPSVNYVYFKNTASWSTVYAHMWNATHTADTYPGPALPTFTFNGGTYYYAAIGSETTVIFGNNNDSRKTGDLASANTHTRQYYEYSSSSWKDFTVSITYKDVGNTAFSGTHEVGYPTIHTYGTSTTLDSPTKDNYNFDGWFQNSTGTGSSVSTISGTAKSADFTLYAKWSEITHDVRAHYGTGGSAVTPSSWTAFGEVTGGSVSATNATGYHFDGWTIDESKGGSFTDASLASTTFYPVANDTWITAHFAPNTYTITLDGNEGSDGSATATYNSSTLTITHSSRVGYSLDGYFTATSGGTKVINADGTLVASAGSYTNSSSQWIYDDDVELHAQWTENLVNYTVTYGVKSDQTSLGTLSCATTIGGSSIDSGDEVAGGTGITFTAAPISGYEVDAWCSNAECTKPIAGAGYANTYALSLSQDTTVYVKFKKKVYTITYSPSSAPTGCTYTTKPATGTYGNTVTMSFTPSTGYTVSVSARDASSNPVTISNPSANTYTFTQPASAVTVTVTATEVKSTITVTANNTSAGSLKFGETSKAWGQTPSLGVSTSQAITATANTGYVFCNWSLSGAAASASDLTGATITLKADGSGNTGTATAMFYEDYYYRGEKNSWGAAKMTPHPCGYYAYYSTSGTHNFKVTPNSDNYTGECSTYDNSYGDITLTGGGGSNVYCPETGSHYICILYPNTAINDGASPIIFASTTLPDLVPETTYSITCSAGANGSIHARTTDIAAGNSATVQVGATARALTATPATGYHFTGWTKTGSVTIADASSTSTTMTATGTGTVTATWAANTVYFVNSEKWSTVKIYGWDGASYGDWPGTAMTDAGFDVTIDGRTYDVYKKEQVPAGSHIIFNNGEKSSSSSKKQTANLSADDAIGKYFFADECFGAGTDPSPKPDGTFYASTSAVEAAHISCYQDHRVTFGVVGSTGGTIAGRNTTTSSNISSGAIVGLTNAISLTATPSSGYAIEGWYTDAEGSELINHNKTAYTKTFTSSDTDLSVYVKFEALHTVTLSATNGKIQIGGEDATSASVASNTTAIITAVPNIGYYFTGWTVPDGVTRTSGALSDATITIKTTSDSKTVTANFALKWSVAGSSEMGDWDINTNLLGNVYNYEAVNYAYCNFTSLLPNKMYEFKVVDRSDANNDTKWYGVAPADSTQRYTNANTFRNLKNGNDGKNVHFHTAGTGTYTITINLDNSDHPIKVQYPTSHTVTFGYGTGGSEVTAEVEDASEITSGQYATPGKDITFTQTPATGYTFKGWYDAESGGSGIASMASDNVYDNIAGNISVYAQYDANEYAVTFDYSTNGGSKTSGDNSYDVTFDQTSMSVPTVKKDGYCFDGWYTKATGGKKVINANGTFVANVTDGTQYTGDGGAWKKAATCTVYAVYVKPEIIMTQGGKGLISSMPGYDTLIVNQSFGCTPAADYNISYTVGYKVSHTQLAPQPKINYCAAAVAGVRHDTIIMPVADGANSYEVVAYLKTGTTRGSGTDVTTDTLNVDVETSYAVKVRAQVDGVDIAEERLALLYPSFAAISVTIWKEIKGYELDHIELGVGVTEFSRTERDDCYWIRYYAANASTITAVYKPKANTVYLFNATNKACMYAASRTKLYDYTTYGYWGYGGNTGDGAGSTDKTGDTVKTVTGFDNPVWMASIGATTTHFAFTSDKLNNVPFFGSYTSPNTTVLPAHVIYRTDYNAILPMFVPVVKDNDDCYILNKHDGTGQAQYYRGFWVKRSPDVDSTGYYLKVYNKQKKSDEPYAGSRDPELIQSVPLRLTQTGANDTWELTATIDLEANKTYGFKFTKATGPNSVVWYADTNEGIITSSAHTGWDNFVTDLKENTGITTTAAGDYTFHIYCTDYGTIAANTATAAQVQGKFAVTVDYAAESGDYRVIYSDATQTEVISSPSIRPRANGQDTVSFFIRKNSASRVMKIQKFTTSWADFGDPVDLSGIAKDSVYVIYLEQNEGGTSISVTGIDFYDGDYYIRTDCVDEYKWDYKKSLENHRMIPTDYGMTAKQPDPFSHYYVHWLTGNSNVKFIVANKYAPCLSDTVITDDWVTDTGGNLGEKGANIRFMYNKGTNKAMRAYLYGSQEDDPDYLKLTKTSGGMTDRTSAITEISFTDLGNFTYQAEIAAQPGLRGKLTAEYLDIPQYFLGSEESDEQLIGGSTGEFQNILLTYDFKSNRLICAWQPSGATITEDLDINADILIIRKAQGDAQQIRFATGKKIEDVHYIYGVIEFEYNSMYHMMHSWDYWSYAQCMYYISFPFDVLVNDITGVGALGTDWRIQRYNGAKRAEVGWFADGPQTFWEDVHAGDTLHAYEGYSLLLNRSRFNGTAGNIWDNKHAGDKVYLYFPSVSPMVGALSNETISVTVPSHPCNINRTFEPSTGMVVNHKITDSHWNMIGTPMFADTTAFSIQTGLTPEGASEPLQYVYAWNYYGNTLGIQLTLNTSWRFKTMYSYMAQYCGDIVFHGPAVHKSVAAKRTEEKKNYHLNLEISKDDMFIGRTYVELRENAVDSFLLNEDVYMVRNGVNADLFTYAGTYETGANVLPIADQIVQVGVAVKQAGTYTFSMPDHFDGEVILVDKYAQTRTNLAMEDYETALPTGNIIDRFELEININKVATAIDGTNGDGSLKDGNAHKFIENGMMYILQNGALYDAQGKRVK